MITDLSNLDWLQTKKSTILLCSFFINYNFLEVLLIEIHHITNFFCSLPLFLAFFHLFVNPKWFSSLRPHFHLRYFFFKMLAIQYGSKSEYYFSVLVYQNFHFSCTNISRYNKPLFFAVILPSFSL